MIQEKITKNNRRGSTLISSMIAVVIILIALIGTSNFRYYSALDSRKATAQTEAARIALTLCESWHGLNGNLAFNPISELSTFETISASEGTDTPDDFTLLGSYKIVLDSSENNAVGADYFATMSWKDVQPGLRALNVIVSWAQRGQKGYDNTDKSFTLTTYTLN
jgi:Tfp pilus assembly protein PilV